MKLSVATEIPAPAQRVWEEIGKTRLLQYVCAPMQYFRPIDPPTFPEHWHEGQFKVALRAFGFLPVGTQWVVISFSEGANSSRQIRDNGHGNIAKRWDHLITIAPRDDGNTDYRDEIDIEAGFLTPFIWAYAWLFYHHRQRRWRKLARNGFNYGEAQ
jgi:hypothetical protein